MSCCHGKSKQILFKLVSYMIQRVLCSEDFDCHLTGSFLSWNFSSKKIKMTVSTCLINNMTNLINLKEIFSAPEKTRKKLKKRNLINKNV